MTATATATKPRRTTRKASTADKAPAADAAPKFDPYQAVTDRIVALMEAGVDPWRKPWRSGVGLARSIGSGKAYRGINVFLLGMTSLSAGYTSPWWGTYKAIGEAGGQVRKGEKGTPVVFWSTFIPKDAEPGPDGKRPMKFFLRTFTVFNAEQADGLPEKFHPPVVDPATGTAERIEECDRVVADYLDRTGIRLTHEGDRACYSPSADVIMIPDRSAFTGPAAEYYSTVFHELTHSTGHASRLNRPELNGFGHFGDKMYSKEELVAELGAAMVAGITGIGAQTEDNSAAYLRSWAKVLRGDSKLVIRAAGKAQAAADLILGTSAAADEPADA